MSEPSVAREYVVARKVLLDCLALLAAQSDALVLVDAQAIYLQTPAFDAGLAASTTDGDLLSEDPDLAGVLLGAGFRPHSSPGRWFSPEGVPIDLMVPTGALPDSTRRTAPLTGHGSETARRTAGLELALIDNAPMKIPALDPLDSRVAVVKVASPAALVVAKLVKLAERLSGPRADRVLAKDSSDVLRLLRYTDATTIGRSLAAFSREGAGSGTIEIAVDFLRAQLERRTSPLIELAVGYHQQFETLQQITVSFQTLTGRLLDAYDAPPPGRPA